MPKRSSQTTRSEPHVPASVSPAAGITLLRRQADRGRDLLERRPLSQADHTAWKNTTREYLVKAFGSASRNVNAVVYAQSDHSLELGMNEDSGEAYAASQLTNQVKLLESCIEQLETEIELAAAATPDRSATSHGSPELSRRVFVVHGHDHGAKEAVARFLQKLDLEPVILHEKPNAGRTVIEKFSTYADVGFAVVLLTADDEGRAREATDPLQPRARQNVIFELGYFMGKLGRSRVCALYEPDVEIPSDYAGVLFVPFDPEGRWKADLVRELKSAGLTIDANRIFEV